MIVLDTHIIIWDALRPELISKKARTAIDKSTDSDGIIISEISLWEIAMLHHKGRLKIDTTYLDFINLIKITNKNIFKGISAEIADISVNLPSEINLDPADRIICATAKAYDASLVTADDNIIRSKTVRTIW